MIGQQQRIVIVGGNTERGERTTAAPEGECTAYRVQVDQAGKPWRLHCCRGRHYFGTHQDAAGNRFRTRPGRHE